jgi:hypothetical protein
LPRQALDTHIIPKTKESTPKGVFCGVFNPPKGGWKAVAGPLAPSQSASERQSAWGERLRLLHAAFQSQVRKRISFCDAILN